jgi:hypothetical protein
MSEGALASARQWRADRRLDAFLEKSNNYLSKFRICGIGRAPPGIKLERDALE